MEQNTALPGNGTDLGQRLDRADFIVGVHDADQNRFTGNSLAHGFRIDSAAAVNRQNSHGKPLPLQPLQRIEHGRMFNGGGNNMSTATTVG